jgi:hypothetical protein
VRFGDRLVINDSAYRLGFTDSGKFTKEYLMSFVQVVESLQNRGFVVGRDFLLARYSPGAIVGSGIEQILLEATPALLKVLTQLDFRVEFSDVLGRRYEKEIYCIPREGIEKHMPLNWL